MMTRSDIIRAGTACAALLLLAGCSSVTSRHPLSDASFPVDRQKFEGVWYTTSFSDEVATVDVQFLDSGVARYATIGWEDHEFKLEQSDIIITEGKAHNFMSIRPMNATDAPEGYFFLQYTLTAQGELHLWLPNVEAFQQAVSEGLLQGTVETGRYQKKIAITDSPAALLDFLNDPARGDLFDYEDPLVFRRIVPPKKSEPAAGGDDTP